MIHVGQLVERKLLEQGRKKVWFAKRLCCERGNVYRIFQKESLDISLLRRISLILGHNFFQDIADAMNKEFGSPPSKIE